MDGDDLLDDSQSSWLQGVDRIGSANLFDIFTDGCLPGVDDDGCLEALTSGDGDGSPEVGEDESQMHCEAVSGVDDQGLQFESMESAVDSLLLLGVRSDRRTPATDWRLVDTRSTIPILIMV